MKADTVKVNHKQSVIDLYQELKNINPDWILKDDTYSPVLVLGVVTVRSGYGRCYGPFDFSVTSPDCKERFFKACDTVAKSAKKLNDAALKSVVKEQERVKNVEKYRTFINVKTAKLKEQFPTADEISVFNTSAFLTFGEWEIQFTYKTSEFRIEKSPANLPIEALKTLLALSPVNKCFDAEQN